MSAPLYRVIVWHNDCVNGTHQATIASGKTAARALLDFSAYLQRPVRSFNDRNLVQLVGPDGWLCDLPAVTRGEA